MKKLIIATSVLFAFSSVFAQKERTNVKPTKSIYQSKTQDARTPSSKPAGVSNEAKPNKPVGPATKPATKPAPVVSKPAPVMTKDSPVKGGSKPLGISTKRASQSAVGTVNEKTPTKLETKDNSKISKSRASESAVGTVKEKTPSKLETEKKSPKVDADYCKGWEDGFKRVFQGKEDVKIPKCKNNGKCEGYKCGYEAGMAIAETMYR